MKNKKVKKLINIMVSILGILLFGLILYLWVQSSFYKMECIRGDEGMVEYYDFTFNILKEVKTIERKIIFELSTEEQALEAYKEEIDNGKNVELVGKNLVYIVEDIGYDFGGKLKEAQSKYSDWGYVCDMVRK